MFRRRRENKTDYKKRMNLLKGDAPRITFRKTNKYLITQYVSSKEAKDSIGFGITTKELSKYGWPKKNGGSFKSIPASYFLGILAGKKIRENKMKVPVVDFGMIRTIHKTKPFAFLKGLVDSGVGIKHEEKTFPDKERIQGKHIKNFKFDEIKSKILEK